MLLIAAGVTARGEPSLAADSVCGDRAVEGNEQCDDGNLTPGDGCSSQCTAERCGNRIRDITEQCDDGNLTPGDGCSAACYIEFCGDGTVQAGIGEQCDDGNGIPGDGCSETCRSEETVVSSASSAGIIRATPPPRKPPPEPPASASPPEKPASASSSLPAEEVPLPTDQPATPVEVIPSEPQLTPEERAMQQDAVSALELVAAPTVQAMLSFLPTEQSETLTTLLAKLSAGEKLSDDERAQAAALIVALSEAKAAARDQYLNILREFIASPLSTAVVTGEQLDPGRLSLADISQVIDELSHAPPIPIEDVRAQVGEDLRRLRSQVGMDIAEDDTLGALTPDAKPLDMFVAIKSLKATAEEQATTDLPASIEKLRGEVEQLRASADVLTREYGIDASTIDQLTERLNAARADPNNADLQSIVTGIQDVVALLENTKAVTKDEVLSAATSTVHPPEAALRLSQQVELAANPKLTASLEPQEIVTDLRTFAPPEARESFERGGVDEQRQALTKYLVTNTRLQTILATLRDKGNMDMELRYRSLLEDIAHIGVENHDGDTCDDDVPQALLCANAFLADAEKTVRSQSLFSKTVGTLQDYFGIGQ